MWVVLLALSGCGDFVADGDAVPTPGRSALRRLNRSEYDRTVRNLLGTVQQPARDFPPDDAAGGFDNAAEALAVSPLFVELAEDAAGRLVREALRAPLLAPVDLRFEAETEGFLAEGSEWNSIAGDLYFFGVPGTVTIPWTAPQAGRYRLTVRASAHQAGPEGAGIAILVDGTAALDTVIPLEETGWVELSAEVTLAQRPVQLGFASTSDFWCPSTPPDEPVLDPACEPYTALGADRNLLVDWLRVEGPLDFTFTPNPAWDAVMLCVPEGPDAEACARQILEAFAPRAWRRPVPAEQIEALMATWREVVAQGDPPIDGLEWALRQVLTSPRFLFHTRAPDDRADLWTVASRLSYFLWSSMPDAALFAAAADGSLADPAVLRAQAARMLRDPKAEGLTEDFAGQWLAIRMLDAAFPDPVAWPAWNEGLRGSMRLEMLENFRAFVGSTRSFRWMLDADRGYVDAVLASHYGVSVPFSFSVQPVDLEEVGRGGLLGQAGLQTALSYPTRTSPVRRGVWVLTNLLCDEPEPPPPGVEGLPEVTTTATTVAERLALHRAKPQCAVCHDDIDPVGLAFEHFDGIGAWREYEGDRPVDARGQLPDGTEVDGVRSLAEALSADPRYSQCIARKLWTYAHQRLPHLGDEADIARVHDGFLAGDMTLDALVVAIITQPSFVGGTP